MGVIEKVAFVIDKKVKRDSSEWLDNEISENKNNLRCNTKNLDLMYIKRLIEQHKKEKN